jgi:hypothetical protein
MIEATEAGYWRSTNGKSHRWLWTDNKAKCTFQTENHYEKWSLVFVMLEIGQVASSGKWKVQLKVPYVNRGRWVTRTFTTEAEALAGAEAWLNETVKVGA